MDNIRTSLTNELTKIINYSFTENKNIFEFGSRYGEDSTALAAAFPQASIYAFECNPNTITKCREACSKYSNLTLTEKAISNICGTLDFYPINKEQTKTTWEDGNQGASSLLQASGEYPVETYIQDHTKVISTTLKNFMIEKQLKEINFLWMDIQGGELMALEGLEDYLDNVNVVYTEVEFIKIYKDQPLFTDIKFFLEKNNFIFLGFLNKSMYSGDAIFVNNKRENIHNKIRKILFIKKIKDAYKKAKQIVFRTKNKLLKKFS